MSEKTDFGVSRIDKLKNGSTAAIHGPPNEIVLRLKLAYCDATEQTLTLRSDTPEVRFTRMKDQDMRETY